eukprot:gnl/TRDRNA2_/TRDRNA2_84798_c0_seq1.p1 gnl/TRDRNA2_/TRDRNA2_84798_c0~~gnl/TRDRNA2_/TRDRNA2_84798_c0_seq1.p1  ORF type:complete len:175 (-),score=18.12 gnl/TRDRNA2_/TRDRNA2_84798_c0_seq1:282-806(-)
MAVSLPVGLVLPVKLLLSVTLLLSDSGPGVRQVDAQFFQVTYEDKMYTPPGVTGADLLGSPAFNEHVARLIAAALIIPEGPIIASDIQLSDVTVITDNNAWPINGYGGIGYGQKFMRCTARIMSRLPDIDAALKHLYERNRGKKVARGYGHQEFATLPTTGATPWRRVQIVPLR